MKFRWLILTFISFVFFCRPAHAGKLLFWRYESNQNRLVFSTDQGVQPTAQLIMNPTRLVIDLPGTILGKPTITQNVGGTIKSVRIGQFDSYTTRVVVELAPGYTLNPQGIKIRGISSTQWTVDLPKPERDTSPPPLPPSTSPYDQSQRNNPTPITTSSNTTLVDNTTTPNNNNVTNNDFKDGLKITSTGLLFNLNGNSNNKIDIKRSRNKREIKLELSDINVPSNFPEAWNVNQYGIKDIKIAKESNITILTLNVDPNSPDWQASFVNSGGLLLWPQGGMNALRQKGLVNNNSNPQTVANRNPVTNNNITRSPSISKTQINSIEINNNQLVVSANQKLQARGTWNNANGVYELRIENADLSPNFKPPRLTSNSPISRLRIWQPDSNTVILLAQPALGVRISQLNQPRDTLISLSLTVYSNRNTTTRSSFPNTTSDNSVSPLDVTPPPQNSWQNPPVNRPPQNSWQNPPANRVSNSKALVVIDPGHGGKDPGAIGIRSIQEKHVVMAISQEVARILEQQGIQVRMTRNSDYFVSLQDRTAMANKINADLFVSIHANSAGANKPQVSGLETYYFQNGRNLAATIHQNILRRVDVKDRKVRQARFYVIRTAKMPSVLVETGFLTGTEDAAKLSNSNYQKQMAEAIAFGIIEYIRSNRL